MNDIITVENKIEIMKLAQGNIERYKEMLTAIYSYSPEPESE